MYRYFLLVVSFGASPLGHGTAAPAAEQQAISTPNVSESTFRSLQLGAGLASIRTPAGWRQLRVEELLSQDAFKTMLCFVAPQKCAAWTDQIRRPNGWPTYMVAVFSDPNRTNLTDLIRVRDGDKAPFLAGSYQTSLESIRPGTTIKEMYSKIGVRQCEYYLQDDKTWCVRFVYFGYRNAVFVYEATAATGVIFSAGDRGI